MKRLICGLLGAALISTTWPHCVLAADLLPGEADFGEFTPSRTGGEFVEIHIKKELISLFARLIPKSETEAADVVRGLEGIRVNVIGLDDDNRAEVQKRVKAIREKLAKGGWERIVTAQKDAEDVGIYVKTKSDEVLEGVVVTVLSGDKEAVLVNVMGNIKPERIAQLGERLNIEPLKKAGEAVPKS